MNLNLSLLRKHPQWPLVKKIVETLESEGFKAYLAGGCVRDLVLGVPPKDIDVASSAPPELVESLFAKTIDIGKEFGTIVVVEAGQQVEVTRFRKDGAYNDGRHPSHVEYSNEKEDASRRDFTINAMFYDLHKKKLIDYFSGLQDIDKKCLRTVGGARQRFTEDKLRMMRAFRFSSQLNYEIEQKTLNAIAELASGITLVSKERLVVELEKLCEGGNYQSALKAMFDSGLWHYQFSLPEAATCPNKKEINSFGLSGYVEILAFMCWWHQEKDEIDFLNILLSWPLRKKTKQDLKKIMNLKNILISKASHFKKIIAFDFAYNFISLELWKMTEEDPAKISNFLQEYTSMCDGSGALPEPLLNGRDLMAAGVESGPQMKDLLDKSYKIQLLKNIDDKQSLIVEMGF